MARNLPTDTGQLRSAPDPRFVLRSSPDDAGEEDHFDPKDYSWEFRPPGIQDVQSLVDLIRDNSEERTEGDGNESDEENHVKRISNKFFVYRSHFLRAYRNVVDPASGLAVRPVPQRHISKLAGHVWKEVLKESDREPYNLAYRQLKAEFEAKHPDYRYKPKSKEEKERLREKQKEKRAAQAEIRRVQRKERELAENRRRTAAGYSHRAWRKLKKAVKAGAPDPTAHLGGCIDPKWRKDAESDDEADEGLDLPAVNVPALPMHLADQVLQAAQLLEKNEDMRASQAWQISANPRGLNAQLAEGVPSPPVMSFPPVPPVVQPGMDYLRGPPEVGELGFRLSQVGFQEGVPMYLPTPDGNFPPRFSSESSVRLHPPFPQRGEPHQPNPWYGVYDVPFPGMHQQGEGMHPPAPVPVPVRPATPDYTEAELEMRRLERALIQGALQPLPHNWMKKPAIEFGRTDPSKVVFSTPTDTSSAKRRMVMFDSGSPRSGRDEPDDAVRGGEAADPVRDVDDPVRAVDDPVRGGAEPVRGMSDPVRDTEEVEEEGEVRDAVRSPETPPMNKRMAPSTSNTPFQVIPVTFKTSPAKPGEPSSDTFDHRRSSTFAIVSKLGVMEPSNSDPSRGKGKRRLSDDAQGGRSRQPSLAFGMLSTRGSVSTRSRQPSMVVGLVNGTIKLVAREEMDRLQSLSLASPESTAESSSASMLSEPSDAITELLASSTFDAKVKDADLEASELLADEPDGKHVHAYHWLGASLAAVLEGAHAVGAEPSFGPRMSFSEFISSLPEHMAPDPEALQSIQDQLNEGLVDQETYESLLQYSGWTVGLDDVTF